MKKLVFIADDDELAMTAIKDRLVKEGFDVETASNEVKTKELFKTRTPDVFLADFLFTPKSGIELTEDLEETFPGIKKKTVLITSLQNEAFLSRAIEAGITYCVKKDVNDLDQVVELVKRIAS